MLAHLVIRNFAIIDHLEIPLKSGFTVLTGETGAGKSIIIDALNLLLGGRASTEVIRTDEQQAVVEGIFEPTGAAAEHVAELLDVRGIEFDDQLIIRRIVSREGRNKVFINGSLTTVSNLAEIARDLVDISGQHEHYSLVRVDEHIELVDSFADAADELAQMDLAFRKIRRLRREISSLRKDDRDRLHRIDFLQFQVAEIDSAELERGEEEEHEQEVERLKYAERIADAVSAATLHLHDAGDSAVEQLGRALAALRRVAEHDAPLQEFAQRLDEINTVTTDLFRDIQAYEDDTDLDADTGRLDALIERLEEIKKLRRKHGSTVGEILDRADEMRQELHRLKHSEEEVEHLELELDEARQKAWTIARKLSQKRRDAALKLQQRIESELADLNMGRAQFEIAFEPPQLPSTSAPDTDDGPPLTARGFDTVEFLLAPNPGEAPRPLANIASGGELSRIMLAIKSVLVDRDRVSTYIFDEIDTGIGGTTADVVGEKIVATSKAHQVLCITHLASIASRGDHHYLVEKTLVDDRTRSTIRPLDDEERVEAIALMLGGARVTAKTRDAARDLLGS